MKISKEMIIFVLIKNTFCFSLYDLLKFYKNVYQFQPVIKAELSY